MFGDLFTLKGTFVKTLQRQGQQPVEFIFGLGRGQRHDMAPLSNQRVLGPFQERLFIQVQRMALAIGSQAADHSKKRFGSAIFQPFG